MRTKIQIFINLLTLLLVCVFPIIILITLLKYVSLIIFGTILFFYLVSVITTLHIIQSDRLAQTKNTWIMVIFVLPVFGFFIFWLFGRKYRYQNKNKVAFKNYHPEIFKYESDRNKIVKQIKSKHHHDISDRYRDLLCEISLFTFRKIHQNNQIDYYFDGYEKYKQLFEDIKKAKKYIHICYFIISGGLLFDALLILLHEKRKQNVEIKIITDYAGSYLEIDNFYIKRMQKYGIDVQIFRPILPFLMSSTSNFRLHKKIVVIDGEIAYMGGMNIGNEYVSLSGVFGWWRDSHVRIRGSIVESFHKEFLEIWYRITQQKLFDKYTKSYLQNKVTLNQHKNPKNWIILFDNGPEFQTSLNAIVFINLFTFAKKRLYIVTPYYIPGETLENAIILAASKKVDVRLLLPENPDKKNVFYASMQNANKLLHHGVKVYLYSKSFVHTKMIISDDVAYFGTANLDLRSIFQSYENSLIIKGKKDIDTLAKGFFNDLNHSVQIDLNHPAYKRQYYPIAIAKRIYTSFFLPLM